MEFFSITTVRTKKQLDRYINYALDNGVNLKESYVMPVPEFSPGKFDSTEQIIAKRFNTLHTSAIHYCRANNLSLDSEIKRVKANLKEIGKRTKTRVSK